MTDTEMRYASRILQSLKNVVLLITVKEILNTEVIARELINFLINC